MPKENIAARVLVVLIMIVELIVLFRAFTISYGMGFLVWIGIHFLDKLIKKIHEEYFSDGPSK